MSCMEFCLIETDSDILANDKAQANYLRLKLSVTLLNMRKKLIAIIFDLCLAILLQRTQQRHFYRINS